MVAAVEEASRFGDRCAAEARRLGLTDPTALSVLGDGAEWIWKLSGQRFPGAAEALDIYHGAEHITAASKAAFGEGAAQGVSATTRKSLGRKHSEVSASRLAWPETFS